MLPLVLTLAVAAAPAHAPPSAPRNLPHVSHAWARPTLGASGMSAVYLDLTGGATPDRLTGASTPAAARLELHRSSMEQGVSRMEPVPSLNLRPGETVRLAPGGYHLMLMGAARPLKVGDHLPVTLTFARAGAVRLEVEVRATAP